MTIFSVYDIIIIDSEGSFCGFYDFDFSSNQQYMEGVADMKESKILKCIISALLLTVILYLAGTTISIWNDSYVDEKRQADVAIVLGVATTDGEVSPVYRERIDHGIWRYNNGYVDWLMFTGGIGEGNTKTDAFSAKEYAVLQGIPEDVILLEEDSTITQENIKYAKDIMDRNSLKTAVLVSDPLHMKRAMLMAEDCGIDACSSPTPTTMYISLKTKIPFLVREEFFYVGYRLYRLFH